MQKLFTIIILLLLSYVPIECLALSSDKTQPVFVESDWATLNHKTGISTYHGHVKLTQGTTVVTADNLVTYTDKHNQLLKAVATGQLASYSTLPDNSKLLFTAVALTINYYPPKGYTEFIGQAKAIQGNDTYAGPQINYDINLQIVTSPKSQQGRTSIVILPSQKEQ